MKFKNMMRVAAFSAVIPFLAIPASAEIVLRFADGSPNRGARAESQVFFAEQVDELTNGDVKIEFYWGGSLLKFDSLLRGITMGTTDLGVGIAAYEPKALMGLAVSDLAAGSADPWVEVRAMYDLMTTNEDMISIMADQNLLYLGNQSTGPLIFECTGKGITKLEDIAGRKFRASGIYSKIVDDLGGIVVPSVHAEVYQHLDNGLIDCNVGFYYTSKSYRHYEVADHVTDINWGQYAGIALAMNIDLFEDLSEENQEALRIAGKRMTDDMARRLINEIGPTREGMISGEIGRKVLVTELPEEERAKLAEAGEPYIQEWIDEITAAGYDGQQIFDEYQSLVAHYTDELEELGYPWNR